MSRCTGSLLHGRDQVFRCKDTLRLSGRLHAVLVHRLPELSRFEAVHACSGCGCITIATKGKVAPNSSGLYRCDRCSFEGTLNVAIVESLPPNLNHLLTISKESWCDVTFSRRRILARTNSLIRRGFHQLGCSMLFLDTSLPCNGRIVRPGSMTRQASVWVKRAALPAVRQEAAFSAVWIV